MKSSTETVCAALKHLAHPSTVWGMMEHISNTRGKSYIIAVHTEGVYGISPISSRIFFYQHRKMKFDWTYYSQLRGLRQKGTSNRSPLCSSYPATTHVFLVKWVLCVHQPRWATHSTSAAVLVPGAVGTTTDYVDDEVEHLEMPKKSITRTPIEARSKKGSFTLLPYLHGTAWPSPSFSALGSTFVHTNSEQTGAIILTATNQKCLYLEFRHW